MIGFELIVLGGGPAGYHAAGLAANKGINTALIETGKLGGVCLNEGCIPLKTLLHSSKLYNDMNSSSSYGIYANEIRYDHAEVVERKNRIIKKLTTAVEQQLRKSNVTIFDGFASILEKQGHEYVVAVKETLIRARNILIATGSSPIVPEIPGIQNAIDNKLVILSKDALELTDIPKRIIVVGGGFIGLEFASYFSSVGSDVTIVERLATIGGSLDEDISRILLNNLKKQGVKILLDTEVSSLGNEVLVCRNDKDSYSLGCDKVLISVGRRANVRNIGLEQLGINHGRGGIVTDEYMSTNLEGILAAGDVNGKSMLAHTAYREAEVAINNMTGRKDRMRYNAIPSVIYSNPEVAFVGIGQQQAALQGIMVEEINLPLRYSGRYMAEVEDGNGICKIVVDKKTHRLLGVHMIGRYVSEIIYGAAFMIESEYLITDLQEIVFPHPTIGEVLRETFFMYKGGYGRKLSDLKDGK